VQSEVEVEESPSNVVNESIVEVDIIQTFTAIKSRKGNLPRDFI
jgi:hypothetical protein